MILLQLDRLLLRNYTMEDVSAVHACFSMEEVSRCEDFFPMTVEEVAEGLSEWNDMDERNTASAKLSERLGFQLYKTVDDAYKENADGKPIMIRSSVSRRTA